VSPADFAEACRNVSWVLRFAKAEARFSLRGRLHRISPMQNKGLVQWRVNEVNASVH